MTAVATSKAALVFYGQMTERQEPAACCANSSDLAEYFRDEVGTDFLLFIDNNSDLRKLIRGLSLVRPMPSQCDTNQRCNRNGRTARKDYSTKKGSITSSKLYIAADDYTDPRQPQPSLILMR